MLKTPLISVVVPVYFEEKTLDVFYARMKGALRGLEPHFRHEIIFVNDGSTDNSLAIMRGFADKDPAVRLINFSRNFGHQMAITAGTDHTSGDAVVVIDSDLQDPPEVVPEMVRKWQEGYQVVYGVRSKRKGESFLKLLTAKLFYRTVNSLSDIELPLDSGDFRLMDRVVVDALGGIREENRYIRGLVTWLGFRQYGLTYERESRYAGTTKFSYGKMMKFAFDGITSFSDKPLRVAGKMGMLVTLCSFLFMIWLIVSKLVNPASSIQGWTSLLVLILFLGGVQLISIGVLGEYIGRIYRETKARPLYVVADRHGFDSAAEANVERIAVNERRWSAFS